MNKVLHIITGLGDGGAEGVLYRLCLNSKAANHIVISLMDDGKYGALLRQKGIEVYTLGLNPRKPSILKFFRLIRLIRSVNPDVVQTWMYHADLLGGFASKIAGIKRIFWGIRHSTLDAGKAKRSTIMIARICANVSGWLPEKIVCCANKALSVHADMGYAKDKLLVIPNGYDLSRFKPDIMAGQSVRHEFGVDTSEFLVGKVGRYDPFKDHGNLLQALAQLKTNGLKFRCLLVGKGLSSDNLTLVQLIRELNIKDDIILAGQRSDIPAVMNALDLHVLASSSEGFPNVLAEAMACGTACVTTNVGDAPDIIGDVNLTCPPGDSKALAELMSNAHQQWSKHPQLWAKHKLNCTVIIQQRFSIQSMVSSYESCWFN